MQRAEARSRCDVGRLEHGARHEPAGDFFCGAADGAWHGEAWLWPYHQHRLCDERLRLCGLGALRSESRRRAATDDEPGGRLGQVRDYGELSCSWVVSHRAEQGAL